LAPPGQVKEKERKFSIFSLIHSEVPSNTAVKAPKSNMMSIFGAKLKAKIEKVEEETKHKDKLSSELAMMARIKENMELSMKASELMTLLKNSIKQRF
jgi:hypothetical protein